MTVKELYQLAKENGYEDYEILLSEPENSACVLEKEHIVDVAIAEFEDGESLPEKAIVLDCWKYQGD